MPKLTLSKSLVWAGIALILLTGLIHLIDAPETYEEMAYLGVLFYLNAAGALLAAIGIYRGQRIWGWSLGALVAFGSIVAYIISRTIGLPMMEVDENWLEPLGLSALLVEVMFTVLYLYILTKPIEVTPQGLRRGAASSQSSAAR